MKRIFVCALTLLLAVSMLFLGACGEDTPSTDTTDSNVTTTIATTVGEESTTTTAVNPTTLTDSTTATTIESAPTSTQITSMLTKPTQTSTTAAKPTDPTSAFLAEFEGWLDIFIGYKFSTPEVTQLADGTVTVYELTSYQYTADYCVHIVSNADKSIRAVYATVEKQDYDYRFSVLSYYVYNSLGLTKMDSDAFRAQFDTFPESVELQNKSEGDFRMNCATPDEFLTFAVLSKGVSMTEAGLVTALQEVTCGACYGDADRALNFLTYTANAKELGFNLPMMDHALVDAGNRVRIANVMRRALKGEEITIGYIGGSVTEGAYASDYNKTSYAGLSYAWWVKTFPKAKVNFVKAGVGGTSSLFGVHRVQEDLLKYDPDFVIVEFGVNDCSHAYQKEAYANLVHRILSYASQPAVMQLYVMNEDGSNAQGWQSQIGQHYDLPQISYRDAVYPEVKNGNILWGEIGADWVHPTNRGHAMIAELIISYLIKTYEDLDEIATDGPAVPRPYTEYVYEDAMYLHKENLVPLSMSGFRAVSNKNTSWMTSEKGSFVFEFTGKRCILAVPATNYSASLNVSVRIDGGTPVALSSPIFSGGAFANIVLLNGTKEAKHTIEIVCNGGSMYIGGFFVS